MPATVGSSAPPGSTTLLAALPLPPSIKAELTDGGFVEVGDLAGYGAADLASILRVDEQHAQSILGLVQGGGERASGRAKIRSALALLHEERASRPIITFGKELDLLLGRGVSMKQLTEFSGVPGVGKTQLAMQLALDVQIPAVFEGVDGHAVYIDTEGSFYAPRCLQMAEALIAHLRLSVRTDAQHAAVASLTGRGMLERIHLYRVHDAAEQLAVMRSLAELDGVMTGRVKLIVVDSIAFHLRGAGGPVKARSQQAAQMAQVLRKIAVRTPLAVVLMNQVTTKVNEMTGTSSLVPALGETWAHMCNVQVRLQWRDGQRVATLYKGLAPGEATYRVTAEGIRSAGGHDHPHAALAQHAGALDQGHPHQHGHIYGEAGHAHAEVGHTHADAHVYAGAQAYAPQPYPQPYLAAGAAATSQPPPESSHLQLRNREHGYVAHGAY